MPIISQFYGIIKNQLVRAWILIHKEELESLWRLLQDENDYFKIEPLK